MTAGSAVNIEKERNFMAQKTQKLKIIPLGGLNEIGKNITVIEYGQDILVIDCGMAFPDEEMLGIDSVIPDVSYLEKNADRVRAFIITMAMKTILARCLMSCARSMLRFTGRR